MTLFFVLMIAIRLDEHDFELRFFTAHVFKRFSSEEFQSSWKY